MATTFDRYEILNTIGSGGMATVYRAHDPRFNREVAIKVMSADYAHNQTFTQRFIREAQTIAALEHPSIVSVYDYGEHEGQPFLVMQYMSNGSLADRIKRGPLPFEETDHILSRIAEALDWAHSKNIIHRDIKPANILFDQHDFPCLADFGIVKLTESTAQLTGSGLIGTPAYMAPEMMDKGGLTHLVDVYALTVTLFQMLTGRQPFEADTPIGVLMAHMNKPVPDIRQQRADLPDAVQAVIEGGMEKDPAERYQSTGALAAAFHDTLPKPESDPVAVSSPTATPPYASTMDIGEGTSSRSVVESVSSEPVPTRRSSIPWARIAGIGAAAVIVILGIIGLAVLFNNGFSAQVANDPTQTDAVVAEEKTPESLPISPTATDQPTTIEPTRHPALVLAETGVSSNEEWEPYIQDFDSVPMALVPAGCFQMGSDSDNSNDNERPVHEICFDKPFWIDVYEVTNAQFAAFGGEAGQSGFWSQGNRPRENIAWAESASFCNLRGARLPTEAEWEYAARGPDSLIFPWGNDFNGNLVNFCDKNCINDWADENVDDGYENTAPVGSYSDGISWIGAYDLSGNVWEWVSSLYIDYPYNSEDGREVDSDINNYGRVMRGGSYVDHAGDLRSTVRFRSDWDSMWGDGGFRCVRS